GSVPAADASPVHAPRPCYISTQYPGICTQRFASGVDFTTSWHGGVPGPIGLVVTSVVDNFPLLRRAIQRLHSIRKIQFCVLAPLVFVAKVVIFPLLRRAIQKLHSIRLKFVSGPCSLPRRTFHQIFPHAVRFFLSQLYPAHTAAP